MTTNLTIDRIDKVRLVAATFEAVAQRLQEREHLTGSEVGRALFTASVVLMSRALSPEAVIDQLAGMAADVADLNGIDLGAEETLVAH